jgi:hypothetical protein
MRSKKSFLINVAIITVAILSITSYLFGFEPECSFVRADSFTEDFSFSEYMSISICENGDNPFVWVVTGIAYPGAQAGRIFHNWVLNVT